MGGLPSKAASHGRRSTMKGKPLKPAFSLSAAQKVGGGGGASSKTAIERSNWETATAGQVPHFASFSSPQDWERHDTHIAKHPYASAGGEESFLSVNVDEKADKDTGAELPTFVSYVPPSLPLFPLIITHTPSQNLNGTEILPSPPSGVTFQLLLSPRRTRGRKQSQSSL